MNILQTLKIESVNPGFSTGTKWFSCDSQEIIQSISPITGEVIAEVIPATPPMYDQVVYQSKKAFREWRSVPAPKRGEIVRQIGNVFRAHKEELGQLISWEMGKPLQEGLGEVQEAIDTCDFGVGLSRQLYGLTMTSEREAHRLYEQYHPYGPTGIVTAFNFPVAVWAWNAMVGAVCGNTMIWKPSSKTPLTAIAIQRLVAEVIKENSLAEGIFTLVIGTGKSVGEIMLGDRSVPLVSFTGSSKVGRHVGTTVAKRFGRSILELGGNNAIIVTPQANLHLAIPAILFSAIGTAGQRCTTLRRLIVHEDIYEKVKAGLQDAYKSIKTGDPLSDINHMGPLVDRKAAEFFQSTVKTILKQGGEIIQGGNMLTGTGFESECYVEPTIAEVRFDLPVVQEERFVPILYLMQYSGDLSVAIDIQNSVRQGLSSAIFTDSIQEAEFFLSASGSDCGIANVNIGTSGAEIGGAFGGEKETGGGRESGSDAWKSYMRRQTNTINYGSALPLAQGIKFSID